MAAPSAVVRARFAVAAIFLANGIITGTWAANIPLVEERLGISHSTLGFCLFAMAFGALVSMPLAGPLIARFGSAPITRISTPILIVTLMLPVLAPSPLALVGALFIFGASNGVMDVAMNAHGVSVEHRLERAVMSSFHAMWSLGGLIGAGSAAIFLPLMAAPVHAVASIVIVGLMAVLALSFLLPANVDSNVPGHAAFALPSRATITLGILCFLAMTSEGAIIDWAALHLKGSLNFGAGLAATGFAAYSASMALSRFSGDWLRGRAGGPLIVACSGIVAAIGLVIALLSPIPALAIAGFAIVGLGLANLVPIFFVAAGRVPGQSPGTSIAAVATIGYSGFVIGPPFIGVVADLTTLTFALGLIVIACLVVAVSARAVET